MQFQLPSNLLQQVVAYDAILKPVRTQSRKAKVQQGNRLTIGVIDCLVPADAVSAEEQLQLSLDMNRAPNQDRCVTLDNEKAVTAIVHHASNWYAFWYFKPDYLSTNPKIAALHKYVYGFSRAFKNTPASRQKYEALDYTMGWRNTSENPAGEYHRFLDYCTTSEVKTNKSAFVLQTILVTEEMICDGVVHIPRRDAIVSYGKTMAGKRRVYTEWVASLSKAISSWRDEPLFTRMRERGDVRNCVFGLGSVKDGDPGDNFTELLLEHCFKQRSTFRTSSTDRLKTIMAMPYFKKEANRVLKESVQLYNDPSVTKSEAVRAPVNKFAHNLSVLFDFMRIFEDATIDHCQQIWTMAPHISSLRAPMFDSVTAWLNDNMPIASYLQIITKKVEGINDSSTTDWKTGSKLADLHDLNDSINMLEQLYRAAFNHQDGHKFELSRPNRWRINEFHDYLAAECFKITTPNEKLPQDFFPQPVRIQKDDQRWSFFQPCDVHQLGSWGKAVRNCVGAADSYRKGIKNKTHFIFLVMLDNQPRYTVQAKLSNGSLTIEQIADVCNKPLSSEQYSTYLQVFGEVILARAAQLPTIEDQNTVLEFA